jgi:hypothetical protein
MDKETRYYKARLGLDPVNPNNDEEFYIMINKDKTITAVKEATKDNPKIILRPVLKELTAREYVEETDKLMNQNKASPMDLESRIDKMKE